MQQCKLIIFSNFYCILSCCLNLFFMSNMLFCIHILFTMHICILLYIHVTALYHILASFQKNKMLMLMLILTEISVEPEDLHACHNMRKKDWVIIKFKYKKQKHQVLSNRETLQNKSLDLTQLKFSGILFVNKSVCHENHELAYKCRNINIMI